MTTLLHVSTSRAAGPAAVDHPALDRVRSFERVADYPHAAPGGARWLTVADVAPGTDPAQLLGALGFAADGTGPAERGGAGGAEGTAIVFEQRSPATGWLTDAGVRTLGDLPVGAAVLNVVMDVDLGAVDAFDRWYDEEHLPRLVDVPGFDAARRFTAVAGSGAPAGRQRFLALYELADADVVRSEAFAAASTLTPRTEQVMPHLAWASQLYRAQGR